MVSAVIKELRLRKGMTQKQLAQAVYISPGAISQYETGKAKPSRDTLEVLAQYFDVSVNFLLGSSANAEIEYLLTQEFIHGVSMSQFLKLCAATDSEDRATILKLVRNLVPSDASSLTNKNEKVCR